MAPRAFWKGAINFGLVHIPVRMYKATETKGGLHFRELHDEDRVPLKQKRVCPADNEEVPYEHVVKGYEISKNKFVVIEKDELEALEEKLPQTIDIEQFVKEEEIPAIFYKDAYYIMPEKGAEKPYVVLLEAMRDAGKAAVARLVMRMREHLAVVRPGDEAFTVSTLYYADEIREAPSLNTKVKTNEREIKMATQLINSLSGDFEPREYHDEYREKVLDLIERKAKGQDISVPDEPRQKARVIDLMSALEASLAVAGEKKPKAKKVTTAHAKKKAPAKKRKAA